MELHVIKREGRETVVLLDNEMRIVKPVYDYLKFQRQKDKALNTLKASGSDLRTYWEFLNDSGYEYDKVTPKMIAEFIDYLRASDDDVIALNKESKRTNKTINRILSTIHMFYQFEADMQEIDNPKLKRKNKPINFETVCKEAGVSRATLYNNAQLKERILSLRAISKASPLDDVVAVKKDKIQLKDDKIASLREQVKKLEDDKKKLIVQLVDYEELKSENERLKKQLAKK